MNITDLSQPRVHVGIDVNEGGAGMPLRWADVLFVDGRFAAGTAGTDYLGGNFHWPAYEEVWGVFDAADYVGAVGAIWTP